MAGLKKKKDIDMLNGPILGRMVVYTIPIILSGLLQLLFNAVDMVVVGRYAGEEALAAVGSTSSLINLLTNLFIGLSIGSNVLTAHYIGAGREKETSQVVHTSMMTAIISGLIMTVIGFFVVKPILVLMGSPKDILPLSVLYLRIYFFGMPMMLLYNYGSAILRAVGDTRNPLIFLTLAGIINLFLNLFFVIVLGMSVAGVAWATVISQAVSAILVMWCMSTKEGGVKLLLKKMTFEGHIFLRILQIGLPAGIQGVVFSFSNVIIQSSINLFGSIAMAGNAAASSIEGFVYISMNAFSQTSLNFVGQNAGARQYDRIKRIFFTCFIMVTIWGLGIGLLTCYFGKNLLYIFSSDPKVVEAGLTRIFYICGPYFMCGQMEVVVGALRGLGVAVLPMIVSLIGACALRIVWIMTVFQQFKTAEILYLSYPISWLITTLAHLVCLFFVYKKHKQKFGK